MGGANKAAGGQGGNYGGGGRHNESSEGGGGGEAMSVLPIEREGGLEEEGDILATRGVKKAPLDGSPG